MCQQNNLKIITAIENIDYLKKVTETISQISNATMLAYSKNTNDIVELCAELSPDILICDLSSENGEMSSAIKKICKHTHRPTLHVIATASSKAGEAYISDSIKNGADLFMENLDNPDILRSTLRIISHHSDKSTSNDDEIEHILCIKTDEILHKLMLPVHCSGYYYLKSAITRTAMRNTKLPDISCRLYSKIAEEFETNPRHVERAICKAVKRITTMCQKEYILYTILEYSINPLNYELNAKELIALIADQLRLNYISL